MLWSHCPFEMSPQGLPGKRISLNGPWEFQTHPDDGAEGWPEVSSGVPKTGWSSISLQVPSWWSKSVEAVRKPGGQYFGPLSPEEAWIEGNEFLYDGWDYPVDWARSRSGWARRKVTVEASQDHGRWWLHFDAISPACIVFVDGIEVARNLHPSLPFEVELKDHFSPGEHEIAVRFAGLPLETPIDGHPRRRIVPTGNWIVADYSGIWQDAWMELRGELRVSAVVIRTSVRKQELHVAWTVSNDSAVDREIRLDADVLPWVSGGDPTQTEVLFALGEEVLLVPAFGSKRLEKSFMWPDAPLWSPENPCLLWLRSRIIGEGGGLHLERFGFREVCTDGPDLLLNGHPVHLFSDWGHSLHPWRFTEGFLRKWFGLLQNHGYNHVRFHTHPHPPLALDIADEIGLLVTCETGLFGSSRGMAGDDPRFWQHSREHVKRLVARDQNHPSVILWSVCNEMRWNGDRTTASLTELPKLKALFEELDPSRPSYFEGDTSLWEERSQAILSRHYGKDCSGLGWWDRSRVLTCGELSMLHYNGPNTAVGLIGDRGWADFREVERASAEDARWIIEAGRTVGVACFSAWSMSGNQLLRNNPARKFLWPDPTAPGLKPTHVRQNACEYRFWESGAGVSPDVTFATISQAYRPLAVIDRSPRSGWITGGTFRRQLFVVNDTPTEIHGELVIRLETVAKTIFIRKFPLSVGRGRVAEALVEEPIDSELENQQAIYSAEFVSEGRVCEGWSRRITIHQPAIVKISGEVGLLGDGGAADALKAMGISPQSFEGDPPPGVRLLIVGRNAVTKESGINRILEKFTQRGGRVLVLDQTLSPFPEIILETQTASKAWIRAPHHPAMAGLTNEDLAYWGDDPYAQLSPDHLVVQSLYRKDDGTRMLALVDAGEGGFGHGTLEGAACFAVDEGEGLVIACQLRLCECFEDHPGARRVFSALLKALDLWEKPQKVQEIVESNSPADAERARNGAVVYAKLRTAADLEKWGETLGMTIVPATQTEIWNVVKAVEDPVLDGISNEDACGIERWTYAPPDRRNDCIAFSGIRPAPGVEALWQTAPRSGLKTMFVDGGQSETIRAHMRSRFIYGREIEPVCVVMAKVRLGRGMVILDSFSPPCDTDGKEIRTRHLRLRNRLLANLGRHCSGSIFKGELGQENSGRSPGWPADLYVRHEALKDAEEFEKILQACVFTGERFPANPIRAIGNWQKFGGEDGAWTFEAPPAFAYLVLESPRPRKMERMPDGFPNPEYLTCLVLEVLENSDEVDAELWINGHPFSSIQPAPVARWTDISIEQGFNHALIRLSGIRAFRLRFETLMRKPEREFQFPHWG